MKKNAFTLVEVLIVIVIFGSGILAILKILTHSIWYFDTINMQTRATLLAKEAMEIIFNHRDSNLVQGYPRNYLNYDEKEKKEIYLSPNQSYKVSIGNSENYLTIEPTTPTNNSFEEKFKTFALVHDEQSFPIYRYAENDQKNSDSSKGFARWIQISPVLNEKGNELPHNKILKVSAHTLYQRGSTTGEVILESFLSIKNG